MKTLEVRPLNFSTSKPSMEKVSIKLDEMGSGHAIRFTPWPDYPYKPEVRFNIGYNMNDIYLKFYIQEEYIRAVNAKTNENVWEDSCVELFLSPFNDGVYYNFEFNCIGTCLVQKGISRNSRTYFEPSKIQNIETLSSLGRNTFEEKSGSYSWDLTVLIPTSFFFDQKIADLKGRKMSANFYKCGDKLTVPHFVSWNSIGTDKPDFHQPNFFGELYFS